MNKIEKAQLHADLDAEAARLVKEYRATGTTKTGFFGIPMGEPGDKLRAREYRIRLGWQMSNLNPFWRCDVHYLGFSGSVPIRGQYKTLFSMNEPGKCNVCGEIAKTLCIVPKGMELG